MACALQFCIFAGFLVFVSATSKVLNKPDCDEFSKEVTFNDSDAVGVWHLLHCRTEMRLCFSEGQCAEYSFVTDQERKQLSERIGKYVNGVNWEALTLKMQIPCSMEQGNRTWLYFFEKIRENGTFRAFQTPLLTETEMPKKYKLNMMRLKVIEKDYLGMMDCNTNFVFVLGRKRLQPGNQLPERFLKLLKQYWPDEGQ